MSSCLQHFIQSLKQQLHWKYSCGTAPWKHGQQSFEGFFLSIQSNKCNVFLFVFLIYSTYHPVLIIFTRIICNALDGVKSTVNLHMQYSGVIKTSLAFGLKMLNVLFLSKIFIYTYTDFNYTQLINKWIKGK